MSIPDDLGEARRKWPALDRFMKSVTDATVEFSTADGLPAEVKMRGYIAVAHMLKEMHEVVEFEAFMNSEGESC